jgi:threonine dehydrogenase-like Zn-dependent dehydrogenase
MTQLLSNAFQTIKDVTTGKIPTSTKPDCKYRDESMKALAWYGNKNVQMIDTPVPTITEPKDAIVRVTGTTVCGSDLHLYHNEIMQLQQGDILGHEFCGIVDEVGPDCKLLKGQRVVASFQIACGTCEYCKKGLSSMCDLTNDSQVQNSLYGHRFSAMFGYGHFTAGFAGGQAEYVRVPFADTNLLALPDDVPDEKGLYLSDILCTSFHACTEAHIEEGQTVGIWGLGPIGICCAYWAKLMGASRVFCIDNVPFRLKLAEELGCETINFDEKKPVDTLQEICPGGIDKAIDCAAFRYTKGMLHTVERVVGLETDSSEVVNECVTIVKKFGYVVLIADYAAYTNHFNIGAVMEKGIRFIGGGQAPVQKYWKDVLSKYIQTGKLDKLFDKMVTHRFRIDEIPAIYESFDKKEKDILKVFVETKFSAPPAPGFPRTSSLEKTQSQPAE